jgi:hypothetical protein
MWDLTIQSEGLYFQVRKEDCRVSYERKCEPTRVESSYLTLFTITD